MAEYVSMRKILAFVLLPILAAPVSGGDSDGASAGVARAGKAAPAFSWEKLMQGPAGTKADLSSLRGRVVVIEFWAMGCGPCVIAIPWWNKLVDRFSGKAVTFIAVTPDNDRNTLRRFLDKHPMRGWIALDPDRSMPDAYGVNGIPSMVVIDPTGKVVGWTDVYNLVDEPQILERILRRESVKLGEAASAHQPHLLADVYESLALNVSEAGEPLFLILIRPASGSPGPFGGLVGGTSREHRTNDVTIREAVDRFFPVRGGALQFEFEPSQDKYDIFFRWPKGDLERGRALLRDAVEATFDIRVTVENRLRDVYVMAVDKERLALWEAGRNALHIDPDTGNSAPTKAILERMNSGEAFFFGIGDLDTLANGFSYALDLPVVDETGADGHYTFCFPWSKEKSTVAETIALAKEHLGVTLTRTKREIDVHVVRRRTPEAGHEPVVNDK